MKHHPLTPKKLAAITSEESLPFATSDDLPIRALPPAQPRALQALELSLHLKDREHNIFVSGSPGLGRTFFTKRFLTSRAIRQTPPFDWLYLYNFEQPDRPTAISLSAGEGRFFQQTLKKAIQAIRKAIPSHFEQEVYLKKQEKLIQEFNESREDLMSQMEDEAAKKGFNLDVDDQGMMALYPLVEGKVLTPEEFGRLSRETRKDIKFRTNQLMDVVLEAMRQIGKNESELEGKKRSLDAQEAEIVLRDSFAPLKKRYSRYPKVKAYLLALKKDILENLDEFKPKEKSEPAPGKDFFPPAEDFFQRYQSNLFVDNGLQQGAPIIVEENPTFFNLLGCIERETEWGTLLADFTLLKAGSLHRANGGYLIINAEQLLSNSSAWEGLLRCLRSGHIKLEDPGNSFDQIRTKSLEPEPIPLQIRIMLIGSDEIYELLLDNEERFRKFFKLKAHIQDWAPRNTKGVHHFLASVGEIIRQESLPPFHRSALASLVDYSTWLAQDQEKLSLRFPLVRELMLEASALASMDKGTLIRREHLEKAIHNREFRDNLYEEEFLHEYDRHAIKVPTHGTMVGRAIGLSVSQYGDYMLALPHLISCTIGVGHGGLLDLEREAELGGPIHTKGMMILKSYFLGLFAKDKPLTFTGSLCFEQSYAHVDGDSASGAELAALLSALANIPVKLSLAFTGAVSQSGAIMAVGETSKKIEGFFKVCQRRGLSGDQGVIIPADNVIHLMISPNVINAVRDGAFHIYPVNTIEEAMEILTGVPTGRALKKGGFSPGSLYRAVDDRLAELAYLADKEIKRKRSRERK